MKSRVILVFAVVCVLAGAALVLNGLNSDDSNPQVHRVAGKQVTHFAKGQKAQLLTILAEDPTRRDLMGDTSYSTPEVIPWTSATGEQLIGAMVTLDLESPISTRAAVWPLAILPTASIPDPLPGKRYARRKARLATQGVTQITALVDLEMGKVVSLEPGGPHAKVDYLKVYGSPPGEGYERPEGY